MILEEVVILTRTVPEESKKYGRRVCLAAFCKDLDCLIRLYPVEITAPVRAGDICRVRVCHNNTNDNRPESFKLTDAVDGWLKTRGRMDAKQVRSMLCNRYKHSDTIEDLNARRRSLGVIYCAPTGVFCHRTSKSLSDPKQSLFWDDICEFDNRQQIAPYLQFDGHRLQLREWGSHEWLRKNPTKPDVLWDNLGIGNDQIVVIGNMMNRRNVWMVLKTYRLPTQPLFAEAS